MIKIVHVTAHKLFVGGGERLVNNWISRTRYPSVFYSVAGGVDFWDPRFKTYETTEELAGILASQHSDAIVVIHDPFAATQSWARNLKRVIWFVHGAFAFNLDVSRYPQPLIAISNYKPASFHSSWGRIKIAAVHLGVDSVKYAPRETPRSGRFVCGIVGRVSAEKIPLFFFDFVDKFNAENPYHNIDFVYYGLGDPLSDFYKAFIERSSRTLNFYYKGFVPPAEASSLYSLFDCLVVPSESESGSYAILEAQASGLRVFALNRDGIPYHLTSFCKPYDNYDGIFRELKYQTKAKASAISPLIRSEIERDFTLSDWAYKLDAIALTASLI